MCPYTGITFSACALLPDEATTLFRATTLASTLMEQYMKATATPFVHHALKDTILKIMESKQSCEVKTHNLCYTQQHKSLSYFSCIYLWYKVNTWHLYHISAVDQAAS